MRLDIRPRACGKTHGSVEWVREDPDNRAIVVFDERERRRLMRDYKLDQLQVVNFIMRANHRGYPRRELVLDNAEMMLQWLFVTDPVRRMTFSTGEEVEYVQACEHTFPTLGRISRFFVRLGL